MIVRVVSDIYAQGVIYRGYRAKRALSAMRKHGG